VSALDDDLSDVEDEEEEDESDEDGDNQVSPYTAMGKPLVA